MLAVERSWNFKMKAINSLDVYSDFALKVIEEEKAKHGTKKGSYDGVTPRSCLAEGMLDIYRRIERQRRLRAKWEAEQDGLCGSSDDHRGSDSDRDG